MTLVCAPNRPVFAHLSGVIREMRVLGSPSIRAWWAGDHWRALEGSHRLASAHHLGLTPTIVSVSLDDAIDHDFVDCRSRVASGVLRYLGDLSVGGPSYDFADVPRGPIRR